MADDSDSGESATPGFRTIKDVEERINFVQGLLDGLSGDDHRFEALLNNQKLLLEQARGRSIFADGPANEGALRDAENGFLPESSLGVMAEDVTPGQLGDAVFRLQGSIFVSQVKNADPDDITLEAGSAVEVVGQQNQVRNAGASANVSGLFSDKSPDTFTYRGRLRVVPRVTRGGVDGEDQYVKLANQVYDKGDYTSVDSTLDPGESKIFARIIADRNEFILLRHTNATAHDTVRYEYYMDDDPDIPGVDPDPDLSGSVPWATPPDLHEIVPDGYRLVEEEATLVINETSGNTSYSTVQGTLTAFVLQV